MRTEEARDRAGRPLPPPKEPDLGALVDRAKLDAKRYVDAEIAFLKAEAEARAELVKKPAAMLGAAGVIAWFALFALTMAFGFALAGLIGLPLAFLAVTVIYVIAAAVLAKTGQKGMKAAGEMQADRVRERDAGRSLL